MAKLFLFAGVVATIILADPAFACITPPPEPRLQGESDAAYQVRMAQKSHEASEQHNLQRQQNALRAPILFIARNVDAEVRAQEEAKWRADELKLRKRGDPPIPPPPKMVPQPLHFQPVTWIKGSGSSAIFQVAPQGSTCGLYAYIGDAQERERLLFLAYEDPISGRGLIDAIALDKITDAELAKLIATQP